MLRGEGIGDIMLEVEHSHLLSLEVLVACGQVLGFDMLLGLDAIKKLGGVRIPKVGEACFPLGKKLLCSPVTIVKREFGLQYGSGPETRHQRSSKTVVKNTGWLMIYARNTIVDMKVRLTVALDKRGFVCVWRAGQ